MGKSWGFVISSKALTVMRNKVKVSGVHGDGLTSSQPQPLVEKDWGEKSKGLGPDATDEVAETFMAPNRTHQIRMAAGHRCRLPITCSQPAHAVMLRKVICLLGFVCCSSASASDALPQSSLHSLPSNCSAWWELGRGRASRSQSSCSDGSNEPASAQLPERRAFPRQRRAGMRGSDENLRHCSGERWR